MKNFNQERFTRYFKYDLKQFCNNHLLSLVFLSCSNIILYIVVGIYSYVFNDKWYDTDAKLKSVLFVFIVSIFIVYQAILYGKITQKQTGIRYILLPASIKEKFISMIIISCLIVPFVFFIIYFTLDFVISINNFNENSLFIYLMTFAKRALNIDAVDILFKINFASMMLFGTSFYNLYYLFCGIYFQKRKILHGILVYCAISICLHLFIHYLIHYLIPSGYLDKLLETCNFNFAIYSLNCISIFLCILMSSLIYRRLKKIQY